MKFLLEGPGGLPGAKQAGTIESDLPFTLGSTLHVVGNLTVDGTLTSGAEAVTAQVITASSSAAFAVGQAGATNPTLIVDTSVTNAVTGLSIQARAAGGGVRLAAVSSSGDAVDNVLIDPKGSGKIIIGSLATANTGLTVGAAATVATVVITLISSNSSALTVGPNGATNPSFLVDASTASAATGLRVKSAAAAGGVAVSAISSGTDENLTIAAKGAGTITFNPAVVASAGGSAQDGIMFGSLSVGLFTGTGAPTFSAMNGSIYVDSNATTTTTRIYVNKSGAGTAGTTWTALTTAA